MPLSVTPSEYNKPLYLQSGLSSTPGTPARPDPSFRQTSSWYPRHITSPNLNCPFFYRLCISWSCGVVVEKPLRIWAWLLISFSLVACENLANYSLFSSSASFSEDSSSSSLTSYLSSSTSYVSLAHAWPPSPLLMSIPRLDANLFNTDFAKVFWRESLISLQHLSLIITNSNKLIGLMNTFKI